MGTAAWAAPGSHALSAWPACEGTSFDDGEAAGDGGARSAQPVSQLLDGLYRTIRMTYDLRRLRLKGLVTNSDIRRRDPFRRH